LAAAIVSFYDIPRNSTLGASSKEGDPGTLWGSPFPAGNELCAEPGSVPSLSPWRKSWSSALVRKRDHRLPFLSFSFFIRRVPRFSLPSAVRPVLLIWTTS